LAGTLDSVRFSLRYFALTLGIFALELFIALVVRDRIIRPFVGDVLVVVLIYCFVRSFFASRPAPTALAVFAFACLVELAQYFELVARLELQDNAILRTAIGTHFDPLDILAYAVGTAVVMLAERRRRTRSGQATRRTPVP